VKTLHALVAVALLVAAGAADAQRHHSRHRPPPQHWNSGWNNNHWNNNHWNNDWHNRRDAQRAGVVTGVVAGGVAGSAERQRADQRHADCLWITGNTWECDRRRWDDEMRARDRARRTGVVAGVAAYAIVRN
jgi:opacity protein-like surface antigen